MEWSTVALERRDQLKFVERSGIVSQGLPNSCDAGCEKVEEGARGYRGSLATTALKRGSLRTGSSAGSHRMEPRSAMCSLKAASSDASVFSRSPMRTYISASPKLFIGCPF